MPLNILASVAYDGISSIPYASTILRTLPWLLVIYLLKLYSRGAQNSSERNMHSKVVMVTVSEVTRYLHSLALLLRRYKPLIPHTSREAHQALALPLLVP